MAVFHLDAKNTMMKIVRDSWSDGRLLRRGGVKRNGQPSIFTDMRDLGGKWCIGEWHKESAFWLIVVSLRDSRIGEGKKDSPIMCSADLNRAVLNSIAVAAALDDVASRRYASGVLDDSVE